MRSWELKGSQDDKDIAANFGFLSENRKVCRQEILKSFLDFSIQPSILSIETFI